MKDKQPKTFNKPVTDIPPLKTVGEHKKLKRSLRVLKYSFLFALSAGAIYGGVTFYNTHEFRSPVIFQAPVIDKVEAIKSPVGKKTNIIQKAYAEEKPYSIDQDIKDVFGVYADKAFLLLTCENNAHDPLAKNINDDTYQSIDWGVFQINDHWQKIANPAFLIDPKINIRLAYNIFSRDGYSFKLWTCGRKLGI